MSNSETSNFLVIGSGIAGLTFALNAAKLGSVTIITKKEKRESNTNYAQGGIASVFSNDDSFESHINDTLIAGAGICNEKRVEILVKEGPIRVKELLNFGAEFTFEGDEIQLRREGGHSHNRIVHANDLTGKEIERVLLQKISENKNIKILENHICVDLLTEHQTINSNFQKRCWGVYALDVNANKIKIFKSNVTILATGGVGQVYLHTTNPLIATGDGIAMSYRAGAKISNMEFIQFHPTSLFNSGSPSFLISEALRGAGAILKNKNGEDFISKYDIRGSLASRDIVARAIDSELKQSGEQYVYLDATHIDKQLLKNTFPNIYDKCLSLKIDITKEMIPVVPAAHYCCGGVYTTENGETSIIGLYAIGEVAMTGVHGANRLASNSLLEALVFSYRAFNKIKEVGDYKTNLPEIKEWNDSGTINNQEWILIAHNRKEIQTLMMDYVGIVRSKIRLERAKDRINLILNEILEFYKRTKVTEELIELRNLAIVANLIISSALSRNESRGLHYILDFPNVDDLNWKKDSFSGVTT
ncbi:MAG: L-aspartate oxidase [Bacteroidetes bacterium]|nr:L-aspartate oxidase [Bacteroidota bacterium]